MASPDSLSLNLGFAFYYEFCDLEQIIQLPSAPVFSSVKWGS